ncbi:ADP-heptose:LPS heptosyltransferase [Maribacter aquivivus]|uniref:ADP-heptose:LPS heptosyltransferase n=2 Tax=Maribacter aquivivus TaxID=228958 RepID=A0A1M6KJQ4_9FLAO|nr:glycosyltransferase family 9 protein [Maribacter aquivivus]SHJ59193.1 ADP-heptose:LPS heptosyltransferase [Maribacter aquivivus]
MGDVAMTVPVLLGVLKKYPKVKITVLTKEFTAPIFENIPNVSVFKADVKGRHKGFLGLWKLYKELKTLQIDVVADLHNVLRSTVLKQFFKLSTIPFIQVDKGRAAKKALVNPDRTSFSPLPTTFERYAEVFGKLGYPIAISEMETLSKRLIPDSAKHLINFEGKMLIGIAPFAAFSGKMYPLPLMEEVIAMLNSTNNYQIVLFGGGKKEIEVLTTWETQFNNCFNAAGKLSFSDELGLISNLQLMLAMDSGNAHLAAMFGVPTVTIWGVTHPYAGFSPFNQPRHYSLLSDRKKYPAIPTSIYGNKYPDGYDKVMETILPETIIQKISEILKTPD